MLEKKNPFDEWPTRRNTLLASASCHLTDLEPSIIKRDEGKDIFVIAYYEEYDSVFMEMKIRRETI